MAQPSNTFDSYDATGNVEDVIDVITNISPMDTWFQSSIGSTRAKASYHEWQTDSLATAAANAKVEGADFSGAALTATGRTGNYTQILEKGYIISETQEAVDHYGRASEVAYQKMKAMKELARDIEYALVINSSAVSGTSAVARQLNGLQGLITTNVESGSATGGTAETEVRLNDALQLVWAQGGMPSTLLCGAFQKRTISNFSGINTRNVVAEASKVVRAVDVYESDFGPIVIRLHHQMNTTIPSVTFILGDLSLWKKAWLRPPKTEEIPKSGDATKYRIVTELTLESRQEAGSGTQTTLTTS